MSDSGVSDVDGMLYNLRSYQEYVVSCRECGFYLFRARRIIVDERYWRCFIITVSFVNRMNKKKYIVDQKKNIFLQRSVIYNHQTNMWLCNRCLGNLSSDVPAEKAIEYRQQNLCCISLRDTNRNMETFYH